MSTFDLSLDRGGSRWGHWGVQILIAAILAAIALVLKPLPADSPLAVIAPVGLIMVVLGSWLLMRQHDRGLCEQCLAGMPLDASSSAARYGRRFTVAHLGSKRLLVIAYLLVLIGSNFALLSGPVPQPLGRYLWAALQTTMIYLVLCYSTHRKLQPWCPQCKGGPGDHEDVDAPDPMPSGFQRV